MLKSILIILYALFMLSAIHTEEKVDLDITVSNIKVERGGEIWIGLYDKAKNFGKIGKEISRKQVAVAKNGVLTITFYELPVGTYSIAVFHDDNRNGAFDKNFFGQAKEGHAFLNKKFSLQADIKMNLDIELSY